MPELPEVETIKIGLQKKLVGLTVKDIQVLSPKSFSGEIKEVEGKKVQNVWRRAKVLGIDLGSSSWGAKRLQDLNIKDSGQARMTLLFHLKMTGQLIYQKSKIKNQKEERFIGGHPTSDMRDEMPNSHTRVIFTFSDNSKLFFNDQRRFGWIRVISKLKVQSEKFFQKLGPEPLEKEFSWEILKQNLLRHSKTPVKIAVMDQSVVSGVGNIYASEACFNAKIDPRTKVKELTDEQFQSLHQGALKALRDGIKYGGSSRAHFVDADGHKGYFLDYAYVYGKDKHPCKVCKTEIKKITLGGRGTFLCPNCQT